MRKLISILGIGLLTAACTSAGATGSAGPGVSPTPGASGTPGGSSPSAPPNYVVATGADKLVLRIDNGGGLVPLQYMLAHLPTLTLYGDGRIIVPGPVAEIYPGPLLPNVRVMRVTPAEIQKILAAADEAGLLGPDARYDATNIFDAGATFFTTVVDGKTHKISAYALFEAGTVADAAVTAARVKLSKFRDQMSNLSALLGRQVSDTEAYAAAEMRVFTRPADPPDPAASAQQVVAWPLSLNPATAGQSTTVPQTRCILLSGRDLERFLTVGRTANATTLWTYGTVRYAVIVRPLYPDESGCPGSGI